jgi:peptidoglycan hydrolase CwlO-like protein
MDSFKGIYDRHYYKFKNNEVKFDLKVFNDILNTMVMLRLKFRKYPSLGMSPFDFKTKEQKINKWEKLYNEDWKICSFEDEIRYYEKQIKDNKEQIKNIQYDIENFELCIAMSKRDWNKDFIEESI